MNEISALIRDPRELLGPLRHERVYNERIAFLTGSGSSDTDWCLLDIRHESLKQ